MNYSKKAYFYNNILGKLKKAGIVLGVLLICITITAAVLLLSVKESAVCCDGEIQTVHSFTFDAEKVVAKTTFSVEEKDILIPYKTSFGKQIIAVAKEHTVKVYDGKKFIKKFKIRGTVEDALVKAGIELNDGDETNHPLASGITENITIKVTRGFPVKIKVDGKTIKVNFSGGTVKELLKKADISVSDIDITEPALNKKVKKGTSVTVKRVRYEHEEVKGKIPYKTKVEYDDNKYEDQAKVKQKGKNGKKTETVRKIYVDGKLLRSEVIETVVTKKPTTKIVVRGSKQRPGGYLGGYVTGKRIFSELKPPFKIELDENNRPIKYKKIITGKATAYCTGTTCSTGVKAMPGRVAVDPREIPYGTKMYIVSSDGKWHYGYCTASDTGGFIYTSNTVVDLYMRSYTDCVNFGRRNVDIYILE